MILDEKMMSEKEFENWLTKMGYDFEVGIEEDEGLNVEAKWNEKGDYYEITSKVFQFARQQGFEVHYMEDYEGQPFVCFKKARTPLRAKAGSFRARRTRKSPSTH